MGRDTVYECQERAKPVQVTAAEPEAIAEGDEQIDADDDRPAFAHHQHEIGVHCIVGNDVPNSLEKRMAARTAHLARLTELQNAGRLVVCGPFPAIDSIDPGPAGFTGSLIVAEFASLADAQAWAHADPYVTDGVFASVEVRPFKQVFP